MVCSTAFYKIRRPPPFLLPPHRWVGAYTELVRERVRAAFERGGLEEVCRQLKTADPEGVELIDMRNTRRVVRALERCLQTGKGIAELREAMVHRTTPFGRYEKRVCVLVRARGELRERVQKRTREMFEEGLRPPSRH